MKSSKTVLYLRTDICDEKLFAGGSVAHTLGVIEGLLAHNYTVIIASSIMIELLQKVDTPYLYTLSAPSLLRWMRWKLNCFFSTFFFLFQSLSFLKGKPSIDFIYQRYSILNCTGVLLSKIKKIPLILEYNGSEAWVDAFWAPKKLITFSWLIRALEWVNITYADIIIVVSQPLKDELLKRGFSAGKIVVNPNGVHTKQFDPAVLCDQRVILRKSLGLEDTFIFGFIGTFNKWHGVELMAQLIPQVIEKNSRAAFLLIGDGPLLTSFKRAIDPTFAPNVKCTGLIGQHEAKKYLAACDAFLCPTQPNPDGSPFFGSPTKIFEYLSMAKPIIASDIGQLIDLIDPAFELKECDKQQTVVTDQVGIRVPSTDLNGFIKALVWIMDCSDEQRALMGKNARKKAIDCYDWNSHVHRIIVSTEHEKML